NVVGPKNKHVAAMRAHEIVAELVDENLVARIDGAAGNHVSPVIAAAREHLEILLQGVRRRVNEAKILLLAADLRKGKEKRDFFRPDFPDHIAVHFRDDVNVIASEDEEF